jgi:hypothetical protein
MMTGSDRPGTVRRARLAVMAAAALAGVAACGPVTAGPSGSPAAGASGTAAAPATASTAPAPAASGSVPVSAAPLCTDISHLDTLVVSLAGAPQRGHLPVALPAGITFRDPVRVQAVVAALCALPAVAPGAVSCPADFGGSYRLVFAAGQRAYAPALVRMAGCRTVSGLGPVRATTAAFWILLARELGTRHPMGGTPAAP